MKHTLDILLSICLLLLTLPLQLACVIAMQFESRGWPLYTQTRLGYLQKQFTMYKLRTLPSGLGNKWRPDSKDVGKVGQWIRSRHIDELPQLWNVIKGDMNIVGPRPERPEFEEYMWRYTVPPGITGLAQLEGYGSSQMIEKLWCDSIYIRKHGHPLTDLKIGYLTMIKILRSLLWVR